MTLPQSGCDRKVCKMIFVQQRPSSMNLTRLRRRPTEKNQHGEKTCEEKEMNLGLRRLVGAGTRCQAKNSSGLVLFARHGWEDVGACLSEPKQPVWVEVMLWEMES